jgi:hypothetical protein
MHPKDIDAATAILVGLSLVTGELQYDLRELGVVPLRGLDRGTQWLTTTRSLQRTLLQVIKREGESLKTWWHWQRLRLILRLILALLSSIAMAKSWIPGFAWHRQYGLANGDLIPIWLVVGYSLGLVVQKLASYGWLRFLRLLWVAVSPSQSVKRWRDDVHSVGVYMESKKRV